MKKLLLLLLILSACVVSATPRIEQPDLQQMAQDADIVVIAEVKSVSQPPGYWSGFILAKQFVKYKPVKVLKGRVKVTELDVWFIIDPDNPLVDPSCPQLLTELFQSGSKHVVFLKRNSGQPGAEQTSANDQPYESIAPENHLWSITADESTVSQLKQFISAQQRVGH